MFMKYAFYGWTTISLLYTVMYAEAINGLCMTLLLLGTAYEGYYLKKQPKKSNTPLFEFIFRLL